MSNESRETASTGDDTDQPEFIGWDHPRYEEWKEAVANDETVLGLAAWIDHNPPEDDAAAAADG